MSEANADAKVKAMMSNEIVRHVDYTDDNNKKAHVDIKVQDPGIGIASQILDLLSATEYGELFGLVMEHVLVSPHFNYESLNKDLDKDVQTKEIKATNKQGKQIKLKLKFPGFRTALQLSLNSQHQDGSTNLHETLTEITKEVVRDSKDSVIDMDFWEPGEDGYGLGMVVYDEAQKFLGGILSRDQVLQILTDAFKFCVTTVRPKNGQKLI